MNKLLMLSIIAATLALPIRASRAEHASLGLRRALGGLLAFAVLYWWVVQFVTPYPD